MPGLLDPLKVGSLELRNRIVMPPMANQWAPPTGAPVDAHLKHYSDRAEGVGLVIVEHAYILPTGRVRATQLGIHTDAVISAYRRLVDAVHARGAKIALQINHAGGKPRVSGGGADPVGPSDVTPPEGEAQPRPMTLDEIRDVIAAFGEAARRVKEAGFDAVEVHGAHGYLNNQFMSPYTNRRTDQYGGSLENRMRLPLETTSAARRAVGPDFPLFYRLAGADLVEGGQSLEDGQKLAMALEQAGVNVIDVSAGLVGAYPAKFTEPGFFLPLAEGVRKVVSVPVIGVGGIKTPEFADQAIRGGRADLIAVGRAMLADREWALKAIQALQGAKPTP
ncbi:MAG: NADH:flavin oxidoreductase [Chloroflexi bacterium]|nr:NADH:flavin oxidoreductase [Chloroflexota bacterium]